MLDEDLAIIRKRMAEIDTLPQEWRGLVHEYGWTFIAAYYRAGLKPSVARHLIEETLNGAHEVRARRRAVGSTTPAGVRLCEALNDLRLPGNGHALAQAIVRRGGLLIVQQPTAAMVAASMTALDRRDGIGWVSKERKHRLRLADALAAALKEEHGDGA